VETGKKSVTLTIGWVMLLVLGVLMTLGGLESLVFAYRAGNEAPAGVSMQELARINPELPVALRGRRATAASLAISCGILVVWIAAIPYRRGEKWAWWALLCSIGLGTTLSVLRVSALGTKAGAVAAGIFLTWLLLALAISYRDFK
jgi:hypothetical protein